MSRGTTLVNDLMYQRVRVTAQHHLTTHREITNRILRSLSGITYDQAIKCLGRMCRDGLLKRVGRGGGCRYTLREK